MISPPRLLLDELLLSVEQSGKRLLLVEGPADREFFTWYLGDEWVAVYTAEDVQIPAEWVSASVGARNRLIALSSRAPATLRLRVVVDRDCGHDLPDTLPESLLVTDFPAVESYCYSTTPLTKWLLQAVRNTSVRSEDILRELAFPLACLYLLRMPDPTVPAPPYASVLVRRAGSFDLSDSHVCGHYHLTASQWTATKAAAVTIEGDAREFVYGHDLAELLDLRFRNELRNRAQFRTVEAVERSLRLSLERADLAPERLFVDLDAWLGTPLPTPAGP